MGAAAIGYFVLTCHLLRCSDDRFNYRRNRLSRCALSSHTGCQWALRKSSCSWHQQSRSEHSKNPNAAFTPVSYSDEKKLYAAFSGCDAVAHLVGINREAQRGDFHRIHVEATKIVIHAALRAGVKKIVYVSYLRARPRAFSAYYKSKWEAEELIRNSGLDYTILKPE